MRVAQAVFRPVAPIFVVDNEIEAVRVANDLALEQAKHQRLRQDSDHLKM
ncbi:MAG TPA: hypothetical protein VFJ51_07470 [Nitrososphaeraceae archaeon]|jgi:acyl-CoA reductase-like NAD-dependent aldehyde dehydrogenase|nr:hypothetical protein [Nitrososphaeraceae archaeon]